MIDLTMHYAAERPSAALWVLTPAGALMDLSAYTFSFKVGGTYASSTLTKTTGITGAAGAGTEPSGTPNCVIAWTAGELTTALGTSGGTYPCWLTLTTGGLDDIRKGRLQIID